MSIVSLVQGDDELNVFELVSMHRQGYMAVVKSIRTHNDGDHQGAIKEGYVGKIMRIREDVWEADVIWQTGSVPIAKTYHMRELKQYIRQYLDFLLPKNPGQLECDHLPALKGRGFPS